MLSAVCGVECGLRSRLGQSRKGLSWKGEFLDREETTGKPVSPQAHLVHFLERCQPFHRFGLQHLGLPQSVVQDMLDCLNQRLELLHIRWGRPNSNYALSAPATLRVDASLGIL
jgi:hypothetical protein